MLGNILIIILSVVISSTAHIFLKKGVSGMDEELQASLSIFGSAYHAVSNPWVIAGMFLHVSALFVWLWALSRVDITFAYPFLALGYVLVGLMAWMWLGEQLTQTRLLGTGIIVAGLIVLSQGG